MDINSPHLGAAGALVNTIYTASYRQGMEIHMERKLKILKGVLLLRQVNRYQSKEEQIAEAEKHYTDKQLDEWIEMLKHPEDEPEFDEEPEYHNGEIQHSSCTERDYSPSNPWDAPGMSIRDFI